MTHVIIISDIHMGNRRKFIQFRELPSGYAIVCGVDKNGNSVMQFRKQKYALEREHAQEA